MTASVSIDGRLMTAEEALALLFGGVPSQRAERHVKRPVGETDGRERRAALLRLRRDLRLAAYFRGEAIDPAEFDDANVRHSPSPEEIKAACREIRKGWSAYEREQRLAAAYRPREVTFTQTYDPMERENERVQWRNLLYGGKADLMKAWSEARNDGREP